MKYMKYTSICEKNRFSVFVRRKSNPNYEVLEAWRRWFIARGIPCVISLTSSGYALYREKLIEVDTNNEETYRAA